MIHEYALEPELVSTWGNRQDFRYFVEKFGLGQPRIVSRYPKRWKKLVWEALRSDDEFDKMRLVELLQRLSERMVRRLGHVWDGNRSWLENAHREHDRKPFRAILARGNPSAHPQTIIGSEADEHSSPLWAAPRGLPIARTAEEMGAAVASLLRIAEVVIIVDPYFGPERARHRRPLEAFLSAVVNGRPGSPPLRIEYCTSEDNTGTREFFRDECERQLPRCIPEGMRVTVRRLQQRQGGERLHNRYILTEFGGVMFIGGLDDGAQGETDDLTLLDRTQYELRWSQYGDHPPAFEVAQEVVVVCLPRSP